MRPSAIIWARPKPAPGSNSSAVSHDRLREPRRRASEWVQTCDRFRIPRRVGGPPEAEHANGSRPVTGVGSKDGGAGLAGCVATEDPCETPEHGGEGACLF